MAENENRVNAPEVSAPAKKPEVRISDPAVYYFILEFYVFGNDRLFFRTE